ncbi:response regulator [soil metagenome]
MTTTSPSSARILIAEVDPTIRHSLRDALTGLGYDIVAEASNGQQAIDLARRLKPDLAILAENLPDPNGDKAVSVVTDEEIVAIVLLQESSSGGVTHVRDATISGYLVLPFREADLIPVIEVALARHSDIVQLRERVAELEDALETRKLVERAKGILMDLHGLSEADAFRRMRKTSMDNRKTMREVAEAILLSHDLQLGSDPI